MMPKKGIRRLQRGEGANSALLAPAMLAIEQNPETKKKGRRAVVVGYTCMSVVCTLHRVLIFIFIH
jgi:hypothetical protein